MKTLYTTFLSLSFICVSLAQVGNTKISKKNLTMPVSVKPSNVNLSDVTLSKNFNIRKVARLKIPQDKLKLPARNKVKITAKRPYNPNLEISFQGRYNKHFILLGNPFFAAQLGDGGLIVFNAQKGKEYRMKITLADKKTLDDYFNFDFTEGDVVIRINKRDYRIPVDRSSRQFMFVLAAEEAGKIRIPIWGIFKPDYRYGVPLWMPIKSIQVDEI